VLRDHIVPQLKADVPNQPSEEQLEADPLLSRFTIVFDREGYSPQFFAQNERAAHRGPSQVRWRALAGAGISDAPTQAWVSGDHVTMELAERGVQLSNDLWVHEVRHPLRKRTPELHFLSTDYRSDLTRVAVAMFARWCPENFCTEELSYQ
jgi:hypothetical protein